MKNLIILILSGMFLFPNISRAQFSIGQNVGASYMNIDDLMILSGGTTLSSKYLFKNNIRVGMTGGYYSSFLISSRLSDSFDPIKGLKIRSVPVSVSGEYVLGTNRFRPFFGVGIGGVLLQVHYTSLSGEKFLTDFKSLSGGICVGFDISLTDALSLSTDFGGKRMLFFTEEESLGASFMFDFQIGLNYKFQN